MKVYKIVLVLAALVLIWPINTKALTADPVFMTKVDSKQQFEIKIFVDADYLIGGYQLRLKVDNADIISYQPPLEGILAIGTCDQAQNLYTINTVCVDLVGQSGIKKGDSLGALTLTNIKGEATLQTDVQNQFVLLESRDTYSEKAKLGIYTDAKSIMQDDDTKSIVNLIAIAKNDTPNVQIPTYFWLGSALIVCAAVGAVIFIRSKYKST